MPFPDLHPRTTGSRPTPKFWDPPQPLAVAGPLHQPQHPGDTLEQDLELGSKAPSTATSMGQGCKEGGERTFRGFRGFLGAAGEAWGQVRASLAAPGVQRVAHVCAPCPSRAPRVRLGWESGRGLVHGGGCVQGGGAWAGACSPRRK